MKYHFIVVTTKQINCLFIVVATQYANCFSIAGDTVNFQKVAFSDRMFMIFLGLTTFIVILQFLGILRYNHTIAMLNTTLTSSAGDVGAMGLVVLIVLSAFVSCAHLSFGTLMLEYASLKNTILSLTSSFLGKFDFNDISMTAGVGGKVFLLIYLLTMILIFVNLFITLLCNFMDVVRQDRSVIPKDHEVVDYMLESMKQLVKSSDQEDPGALGDPDGQDGQGPEEEHSSNTYDLQGTNKKSALYSNDI